MCIRDSTRDGAQSCLQVAHFYILMHLAVIYRPPTNTHMHTRRNPILLLPEGEGRDEGKGGVVQPESHRSHETLLGIHTRCLSNAEGIQSCGPRVVSNELPWVHSHARRLNPERVESIGPTA